MVRLAPVLSSAGLILNAAYLLPSSDCQAGRVTSVYRLSIADSRTGVTPVRVVCSPRPESTSVLKEVVRLLLASPCVVKAHFPKPLISRLVFSE